MAVVTCRICNVLQPQSQSPIRATNWFFDRVLGATSRRAGMPELKSTSILSLVTLALLAGVFTQSTHEVRAAEECLSKPGSSAPPGEHWYYRVDNGSGGDCWRLGPTGLLVQKSAPASEKQTSSASTKQSEERAQAQRPVTTGTGTVSAEAASEANFTAAPPAYWLDASRLLNQSSTVPPAVQQPSFEERSTGSSDSPPTAEDSPAPARSVVASAGDALPQAVARAEEPQRTAPAPRPAAKPSIVDDDHTFALLLLMFVTLAIAGPMLHFTEWRRRREARRSQASRWDSAMILNEPDTDVQMPLAPHAGVGGGSEPPNMSVHTDRLEQALHQLLDRLQKGNLTGQKAAHSAKPAEIELKKSA